MKTVLLTGGAGFIGRHIARSLLDAGHQVIMVLRTGTARRAPIDPRVRTIIETDDLFRESESWWTEKLAGVDAVIHAAWYVEWKKYINSEVNLHCVAGTLTMARGAANAGVGHFIGLGTCLEYRLPSTSLSVHSPLEPTNLYAASKLSVYHMLSQFFRLGETTFSWCRIFYLYGEGEHPLRLTPYIHGCLSRGEIAKLSAGTQLRDFMEVGQVGAMIANVIATGQSGAINICSGRSTTIRQLAERIADQYGRRDLLDFGVLVTPPWDPAAVVGVCNAVSLPASSETVNESEIAAPHQPA